MKKEYLKNKIREKTLKTYELYHTVAKRNKYISLAINLSVDVYQIKLF